MIKLTNQEFLNEVESIYGDSSNMYMVETFSEWEESETTKNEIYEAVWNATNTFYDVMELTNLGYLSESNPLDFDSGESKDLPDIGRKKVTISPKMAYLGLPQVPPKAAGGLMANNLISSNPQNYDYIGKGFFGALQDRHQGKQVGNWAAEIRYILPGRGVNWIIDNKTQKPIPNLGAVTNRPIADGSIEVPPDWNTFGKTKTGQSYGKDKSNAFVGQDGKPFQGVYVGYEDTIRQLETPIGVPERLNSKTVSKRRGEVEADLRPPVTSDIDPDGNSYTGTDDDEGGRSIPPGARGYKPQAYDTSKSLQKRWGHYKRAMMMNPALFDKRLTAVLMRKQQAARNGLNQNRFDIQSRNDDRHPILKGNGPATNGSIGDQWKRTYPSGIVPNPYRAVPGGKGYIPTEEIPMTVNTSPDYSGMNRGKDWGRARMYRKPLPGEAPVPEEEKEEEEEEEGEEGNKKRNSGKDVALSKNNRRMWIPDPTEPGKMILAPLAKRTMTDAELENKSIFFMQKADEADQRVEKIQDEMDAIAAQFPPGDTEHTKNSKFRKLSAQKRKDEKIAHIYLAAIDKYSHGKIIVPKMIQTGRFGHNRIPYTPEEQKQLAKDGKSKRTIDNGKFARDENGELTQRPTMGAVRRMVLPNNYKLSPVPGDALVLSLGFTKALLNQQAAVKGEVKANSIKDHADFSNQADTTYCDNMKTCAFMVNKDGTFYATTNVDPVALRNKQRWSWAKRDDNGKLFYRYTKDTKSYNIPMYSPGVIDKRGKNNTTVLGGWDSAPNAAAERRPYYDKRRQIMSVSGYDPKTNERVNNQWDGWIGKMEAASRLGVQAGLSDVKKKLSKKSDSRGGTGENHEDYIKLNQMNVDIEQMIIMYFMENMRNSKALDLNFNNMSRLDMEYSKKTFPYLYAAIRQTDQWLKKLNEEGITNARAMGIRKSIVDMNLVEVANFLKKLKEYTGDEDGSYQNFGQTKINSRYSKSSRGNPDGLKKHVADTTIKPTLHADPKHQGEARPIPKRGFPHYNAYDRIDRYKYLNLNADSLGDMIGEARRNYWEFAAKDMVIKVWQHLFARKTGKQVYETGLMGSSSDEDGESVENAAVSGGGKSKNKSGRTRRDAKAAFDATLGSEFHDKDAKLNFDDKSGEDIYDAPEAGGHIDDIKRRAGDQAFGRLKPGQLMAKRMEIIARREQEIQDSDSPDMASMISIRLAKLDADEEMKVLSQLEQEADEQGLMRHEKSNYIFKNIRMRKEQALADKHEQMKKERKTTPVIKDLSNNKESDKPNINETPDEFLSRVESTTNVNDPTLAKLGRELIVNRVKESDSMEWYEDYYRKLTSNKAKADADNIVSYHAIKCLQQVLPKMDDHQKTQIKKFLERLHSSYNDFFSLQEFGKKILDSSNQQAPEATPEPQGVAHQGGLGNRMKRKAI